MSHPDPSQDYADFEDGDDRQQDDAAALAESLKIAAYVDANLKAGEYGRAGFRFTGPEFAPDGRNITEHYRKQVASYNERKERNRK